MDIKTIDLNFFSPETIASYLIETAEGPVLIETGPDTTFENLKRGLSRLGYAPADVRHVFVTHIHLDHSGGAWRFAEAGSTIYVHPRGAPHLVDPEKLVKSATMIYGDRMDELWGRVRGMDEDRVVALGDGESVSVGGLEIKAFDTPGHAGHHNAYLVRGVLFTGDVAGCRISTGPVVPPTPPPEINVEKWRASIDRIREISPDMLYPTHFGGFSDVDAQLDALSDRLDEWTRWVGERISGGRTEEDMKEEFRVNCREIFDGEGAGEELYAKYELSDPYWMNLGGLARYWRKYRLSDS